MSAGSVLLVPGSWHGAWAYEAVAPRLTEAGVAVTAIDLPSNGGASGLADDAAAIRTEARRDRSAHGRRRPLLRRHRGERGGGRRSERGRPRVSRRVHARHGPVAARRDAAPASRLDRARRGGRLAPRAALRGGALRRLLAPSRRRRQGAPLPAVGGGDRDAADPGRLAEPAEHLPHLRRGQSGSAARAGGDVPPRANRAPRLGLALAVLLAPRRRGRRRAAGARS